VWAKETHRISCVSVGCGYGQGSKGPPSGLPCTAAPWQCGVGRTIPPAKKQKEESCRLKRGRQGRSSRLPTAQTTRSWRQGGKSRAALSVLA
jgi:hypothetical protein